MSFFEDVVKGRGNSLYRAGTKTYATVTWRYKKVHLHRLRSHIVYLSHIQEQLVTGLVVTFSPFDVKMLLPGQ